MASTVSESAAVSAPRSVGGMFGDDDDDDDEENKSEQKVCGPLPL